MTTPSSTRQEVTQLLGDWSGGDETALEKLFPLVEPELMPNARESKAWASVARIKQKASTFGEA
jgi:hypothetical protein